MEEAKLAAARTATVCAIAHGTRRRGYREGGAIARGLWAWADARARADGLVYGASNTLNWGEE